MQTMTRRALLAALLLSGCRFEWNGEAPLFEVEGEAPSLAHFTKLNALPAGAPFLMTGPDGTPWVAFCEYRGGSTGFRMGGNCQRLRLVRLAEPGADEVITGDGIGLHPMEVFQIKASSGMPPLQTLTVHRPGDAAHDFTLAVTAPLKGIAVNASADGSVVAVITPAESTLTFDVIRLDGKHRRQITVTGAPMGGMGPGGMRTPVPAARNLFTQDGRVMVIQEFDGHATAYSTLDDGAVPLGVRPTALLVDNANAALITVGDDGVRSVPLAGGGDRVLEPAAVDPNTFWPNILPPNLLLPPPDLGAVFYALADGLHRVALDGSTPAELVVPGATRLVAVGPKQELAWSHDARTAYVGTAGDGWLDGTQFMTRGRLVRWSGATTHLHFLEGAANIGGVGDLTSVALPAGSPKTLGLNVSAYAELADDRVVALENAVYTGTWNRLVIIDEAAGHKRWLVPSTASFLVVPGGAEVVAAVVTGQSGYDIVRASIPAR